MLDPDSRHILLDLLRPPVGFRLDGAVGTTFTLNLDAALVVPLALASSGLSDPESDLRPLAAIDAIQRVAERVTIFCQAGHIGSGSASRLHSFLEPMIWEVRQPKPGHIFHPKVWFLRYVDEADAAKVRLICMTRNLTEDSSWDLALRIDGDEGSNARRANLRLAAFLSALPKMTVSKLPSERRRRIHDLAESAKRAEWEFPDGVREIDFWPLGIDGVRKRPDRPDFKGGRHLVIAPFMNSSGLGQVAPGNGEIVLVSRPEGLDELDAEWCEWVEDNTYVVSSAAALEPDQNVDSESLRSRMPPVDLSGLHAKCYVVERNRRAHIFVGSANATEAAFGGNVEFLVELVASATRMGIDKFLSEDEGFGRLLEEYPAGSVSEPDLQEEIRRHIDDALRAVAELAFTIDVTATESGFLETVSTGRRLTDDFSQVEFAIALSSRPNASQPFDARSPVNIELGPVPLEDVTAFAIITAKMTDPDGQLIDKSTIVKCDLRGEPASRLDQIVARTVDTPQKFLAFLMLLLGITPRGSNSQQAGRAGSTSWLFTNDGTGVFETLVTALADRPRAIEDLGRLVARLSTTEQGRAILPPGFETLWQAVQSARERLSAAGMES